MTTIQATLSQPIDAARHTLLAAATDHGYALGPASTHDELVFQKGVSAMSWGSQLATRLESVAESQTQITVTTGETFAITDWGRGERAATKVLTSAGATVH